MLSRYELARAFVVGALIGILAMFVISNQNFSIVNGTNFNDVDKDYWLCFGQNATITNSYAKLTVNDNEGSWTYSKVQQGILPHGWTRKDTLAKEIIVDKMFVANEGVLFIRIIANRSEFHCYSETESWVNFGVGLWFKLNDDFDKEPSPQNKPQLVVDIRFVSTKMENGNVTFVKEDIYFKGSGDPDYDYHYLVTSDPLMRKNKIFYDITVDVGKSIERAFEHYNINKGILKCVELYIEANYGYGNAHVDFFEFQFKPEITSKYTFMYGGIFGVTAIIIVLLILMFRARKNKSKDTSFKVNCSMHASARMKRGLGNDRNNLT